MTRNTTVAIILTQMALYNIIGKVEFEYKNISLNILVTGRIIWRKLYLNSDQKLHGEGGFGAKN